MFVSLVFSITSNDFSILVGVALKVKLDQEEQNGVKQRVCAALHKIQISLIALVTSG